MKTIIDFHIHSKYARATSKNLDLQEIARWSKIKGVDIVSCGDFTHPRWFAEIKKNLTEEGSGFLTLQGDKSGVRFLLGTEVACIYRHRDATRRLHHVIVAPSVASVEKINAALTARGCKLASDGRPILGMSSKDLLQIVLEADARSVVIPAHAWTPWFAIFGSKSGYDSPEECFEDLTPHVFALETGLSSDPEMNWALSKLDRFALVSNSDAHSGPKIGREANVFDLSDQTYDELMQALRTKDPKKFLYTIEFFPEEGMYHYDGHRLCGVSMSPAETKRAKGICPVCKKPMTIGVLNRVDNLHDREIGERPKGAIPFKKIVPLPEIVAEYFDTSDQSKKVMQLYLEAIRLGGSELRLLLDATHEELAGALPEDVAHAIERMRQGAVERTPGYDGKYGSISVFSNTNRTHTSQRKLL